MLSGTNSRRLYPLGNLCSSFMHWILTSYFIMKHCVFGRFAIIYLHRWNISLNISSPCNSDSNCGQEYLSRRGTRIWYAYSNTGVGDQDLINLYSSYGVSRTGPNDTQTSFADNNSDSEKRSAWLHTERKQSRFPPLIKLAEWMIRVFA